MDKVRVYELARDLGITSPETIRLLKEKVHIRVKSASSTVEEDIAIIKSPVGMPGRAIRNKFLKDVDAAEKLDINCLYHCLTICKVAEARFCIAQALLNAYQGNIDKGLVFCGQNAHRIDKIVPVKELMAELIDGLRAALDA